MKNNNEFLLNVLEKFDEDINKDFIFTEACKNNIEAIGLYLLKNKLINTAKKTDWNYYNYLPYILSCRNHIDIGNFNIIKYLVDHGVDVNKEDKE